MIFHDEISKKEVIYGNYGRQRLKKDGSFEIACDCWFTKKGVTMPKLVKYMDDEGVIRTLKDIRVEKVEKRNYDGIATIEHYCKVVVQGIRINIILIFHVEDSKWTMITCDNTGEVNEV